MSHDLTLIIIYGQVRTLETAIIPIYRNIILENHPCHILLSIDGCLSDVPEKTRKLLDPYLMDIYFTNNKFDDDVLRDNNRIEFTLVKNALDKLTQNQKDMYKFMLKIRTDLYIKQHLCLKNIYGLQSFEQFKRDWESFSSNPNISELNLQSKLKAWFLTSGIPFFANRYKEDEIGISPWSLSNTVKWNDKLWNLLDEKMKLSSDHSVFRIHQIIRQLSYDAKVVYLIGSTWIHYGYFKDVYNISMQIYSKYGTLQWPNVADDDVLEWTDHKGTKRSKTQKEWQWITDDQIRLCHNYNYGLIDLVNPQDYIESFDSWHLLHENIKNTNLFAFIVRPQSIRK